MSTFIQLMISGVAIGLIYALAALGVVVVYKATKVLNLAPGGLLLICAYIAWTLLVHASLPIPIAIGLAVIMAVIIGWVVERIALRPLIGQPVLAAIILTDMIWFFFRGITFLFWGGNPRMFPSWLSGRPTINIHGVGIPEIMIWCIIVSILSITALMVYFKFTRSGLAMRVAADDVVVAENLGINITRVYSYTWIICLLLFLITAFFVGSIQGISQDLDFVGVYGVIVALLGGLESFPGAIIAGLVIGIVQSLTGGYLTGVLGGGISETIPFIVMFFVSFFRPYGFFGLQRIERI
ncbi:MAG: branched-chain amino acid ABC transporter permease [Thermodesulfobacteriota bacterium]|nr:branched-chain amino acid ABC transporter permease [Thermodesulfobacteriota bacterium]